MQQKSSVSLLIVGQLFLWLPLDTILAQSSCTPPCVAGEQCQQAFNTNGQYACVAILSPSTAATSSPTATSNSSSVPAGCQSCSTLQTCEQVYKTNQYHCVDNPTKAATSPTSSASPSASSIPAGCQSCSDPQTCKQVYNTNQYHCVDNTTKAATPPTSSTSPSPASVPAGCQACSPSQLCQQVLNSNQYHCVENSTAVAAPASPLLAGSSINSNVSVSSSPCNPACSDDAICEQVFNSKQYACQPKRSPASPTVAATPAAAASVTPGLADPAVSNQAASPSTSKAALSGD